MLKWIVILFIVSVIAGALGWRGVSGAASTLAYILIAVALAIVAAVLLIFAWAGGGFW
jgi:uncharacterized membrane protein YtjA (UPF0391 family)